MSYTTNYRNRDIDYPSASYFPFFLFFAFVILIIFLSAGLSSGYHDSDGWYKGKCTVANYGLEEIKNNIFNQETKMWDVQSIWKIYWFVFYVSLEYPRIQNKINETAIITNPNEQFYQNKDLAQEELNHYLINSTYVCGLHMQPNIHIDNNNVYKADTVIWEYRTLPDGFIVAIFGGSLAFVLFCVGLMMMLYYFLIGDWLKEREKNNKANMNVSDTLSHGTTPV